MLHHPGEATSRPQTSMFKRSLAAVFSAVAMMIPAGQSFGHGIYGGELITEPPSRARIDNTLNIKASETRLSSRLQALQDRFGRMMPDVRLVVVDKDWFQQNNILNGTKSYQYPLEPNQAEIVRRLMSEYVRQRGNLDFHPDSFKGLERDLSRTEGMAIKFQYGETQTAAQTNEKNICLLFPHFADQDRDSYYQTLMGRNASIHGDIARAPLRDPMDYEYMKRFVDYHEIGHCYDRWYIKDLSTTAGPQAFLSTRHKAEIFGETFANLMLARDGYGQFSEKQADLRLAIAALTGPISARMNDPSDVNFYMTYVYLLQEGSRNAGREIERLGIPRLQAMSMDEIINLAHDITERSSFEVDDGALAVAIMMSNSFDLSPLEQMGRQDPAMQRRYELAQQLKADMEGAVRRVLDFGNRTEPVLQPASFNFSNPSFPRMGASALEARGRELAQDLRARMGWRQTEDNLIHVYTQKKDELRAILETGSRQAKEQAMLDLGLMQMALKNAYNALPQLRQFKQSKAADYRIEWSLPLLKPTA